MSETMICPGCGAAAIEPQGRHGYPGGTGYEYVRFACGWHGTRARDNGQFAYTGKVKISPPLDVSVESLQIHGWGQCGILKKT